MNANERIEKLRAALKAIAEYESSVQFPSGIAQVALDVDDAAEESTSQYTCATCGAISINSLNRFLPRLAP